MAKSFAEIYESWEQTHDEGKAIASRARESSPSSGAKEADLQINRIRRMESQDELDLHEMVLDDALSATRLFLDRSFARGYRKVRIITGKGIHSKNGEAVLRPSVIEVCRNHPKVREVSVPKASEGGSGALSVIL
ncbi:MAG: Smr/MutS family protein [Spirochaetales bacterium]|nr:Smr/MutS family protein [Spirochaetales bacterium]